MTTTHTHADSRRVLRLTFWPTVMSVIMVGIALMLGTWQIQRLGWKQELIADRMARVTAAPIALELSQDPDVIATQSFRKVAITGTFHHHKELHFLARDSEGRAGYMIITPLEVIGQPTDTPAPWLLVNRGWVSMPEKLPADRPRDPRAEGPVTVTGLIRPAFRKSCLNWFFDTTCFTPDNEPGKNLWFWSDYAAMAQAIGHDITPFVLEEAQREDPMERPKAGQMPVHLPNNHLQYAITWYTLAVSGFVIWFLYHWRPEDENDTDAPPGTETTNKA